MSPTKGSIMKHSKVIKTSNNWAKPKPNLPRLSTGWVVFASLWNQGVRLLDNPQTSASNYTTQGAFPPGLPHPHSEVHLKQTPPASCSKDGGGIFEDLRSQRNEVWNRTAKGTKPERNSPTAAPHSTKPPTAEPRSHGPSAPRNPLHPASSQQLCGGQVLHLLWAWGTMRNWWTLDPLPFWKLALVNDPLGKFGNYRFFPPSPKCHQNTSTWTKASTTPKWPLWATHRLGTAIASCWVVSWTWVKPLGLCFGIRNTQKPSTLGG